MLIRRISVRDGAMLCSLSGNKTQKREGRSDQRKGTFKEKKGKLKNLFK